MKEIPVKNRNPIAGPIPARNIKSLVASVMVAGLCYGNGAFADTTYLADDNFTNSAVTASSATINNTEAVGVGTYTKLGTMGGNYSISTVSGFGDGHVLGLVSGSPVYRAFDGGTTLTLNSLALNETLSLSFDIDFSGALASDLTFGFIDATNSNSVLYLLDDVSSSASPAGTTFRYRTGSVLMSTNGTVITTAATEPATAINTSYHFELSVTKLESAFLLSYYRDDVLVSSSTVAFTSAWATALGDAAITGVGFRYAGTAPTTYIDNLQVTLATAVPEPTTWAMLMGGAGMLLMGQRLRRRSNS